MKRSSPAATKLPKGQWRAIAVVGIVAVAVVAWGEFNIEYAIGAADGGLSAFTLPGTQVAKSAANYGCHTVAQEFGTYTFCDAAAMKASVVSADFDATVTTLDQQVQAAGYAPGSNHDADMHDFLNGQFRPFTLSYSNTAKGLELTIFTLRGSSLPNSGNILHVVGLGKIPVAAGSYIIGVQIDRAYSIWPNRFLPIPGSRDFGVVLTSEGKIPFTVVWPAQLPAGYHTKGAPLAEEVGSDYYASDSQAYSNAAGHDFTISETKDQYDPTWLTDCASSDAKPNPDCEYVGQTSMGDKVYRGTYTTSDNITTRQWYVIHNGTDIIVDLGIDLTDAEVLQMLGTLRAQ